MANNPLQQYFRQPKIYVSLPSQGIYYTPGVINGDPSRLPVFGMTGMDELLFKTPDALLAGESTAKVISSCCPGITDPWEVSLVDLDLILSAIRIATFGNDLNVMHKCTNCGTEHEYALNLTKFIEHYAGCEYDNRVVLDSLSVIIRPLNYKQNTEFALRNFGIQQKLFQVSGLPELEAQQKANADIFEELTALRNEIFTAGIESIDTGKVVVTEREFIDEWVANVDLEIVERIRAHMEKNRERWIPPAQTVKCDECGHEDQVRIELDQSNFFGKA
jgi:RNase P subunit RPR2